VCHIHLPAMILRLSLEVEKQLKGTRALLKEYEDHLLALKDRRSFTPKLTAAAKNTGKKRKGKRNSDEPSPKRLKGTSSDDDDDKDEDFMEESDDNETMDVDSDSESNSGSDHGSNSGLNPSSDASSDESNDDSESEGEADEIAEEEKITEDHLKVKIEETKAAIKTGREQLSTFRAQKKQAADTISTLKKKQVKVQREKNAFCSLKRSEV
jgi:hypothetical protein